MNTTNANVAAVATDFMVEKSQTISPSATQQIKNRVAESQEPTVSFSREEVMEMAEALNEYTEELHTNLGFSVREGGASNQIVVEIKNTDTNETIKQFPPEELLQIKEKMSELVGLMFDAKA